MKKSLSLFVAITMVFSMFASVAFAADQTAPTQNDKFNALKDLEIFTGFPDGSAGLDQNMTRAQFAKVLTKGLQLEENAAASKYSDVSATHWAKPFIGAVTAAELMQGKGNNKFDPNGNVTIEELAKTLVLGLGLEEVEGATVAGASAWAAGYVQAALDAKIIPSFTNYKAAATRGQLVDSIYEVVAGEQVTVKSAEAVDANTVKVTFSDDQSVTKTLETALVAGQATKVSVEYNGKTYEVEVTLTALAAEAKVVGAKKVEVKFSQAVDKAKATFAVKNSTGSNVNVATVTFAEGNKSATLEFATTILEGTYTLTIGGVQKDALTATYKVEAEKVAKIEFTSDKAPLVRGSNNTSVNVGFKVLNQYGEDVTTAKNGQLSINSSYGAVGNADGVLTITKPANGTFALDEKFSVTALDAASTTFASAVLTVSAQATVNSVTFDKVYNASGNTLTVGNDANDYYVLLSAKDQYGNDIAATTAGAAVLTSDVIVTSSNPTVADVIRDNNAVAQFGIVSVDGTNRLALQLNGNGANGVAQYDGTARLTTVSKTAGQPVSFDVVVKQAAKVDTITLSAPAIAVVGEDITIPFTAVDQFGNAITSASTLNAGVLSATFNSATLNNGVSFVQNYVTNTASLVISGKIGTGNSAVNTVSAAGTYVLTIVTGTGKPVNLTISVVAAQEPKVISGTKDFTTTLAVGATASFAQANVVFSDQYGRTIDNASAVLNGYTVKVVSGSTNIATISNAAGGTVTGVAKGTSTFTVTLVKNGTDVAGSTYSFTVKVVEKADISSYELADIAKLYATGVVDSYSRAVTVNGVLADGSKVTIPASYYNVQTTGDLKYDVTSGKLYHVAETNNSFGDDDLVTDSVIVTVDAANSAPVLTKAVDSSSTAPAVDKLVFEADGSIGTKEADLVVSAAIANVTAATANGATTKIQALAADVIAAYDQYGIEDTNDTYTVVVSGLGNNVLSSDAVVANTKELISQGESFYVTAINSGKTVTFKVIVK